MRYAVMSDVHANPKALETALADARRQRCGKFLMLGDTTGYGYGVREALRLVRSSFDLVLMGNHDSACLGLEPEWVLRNCRNYDVDVAQRRQLSPGDRAWLAGLPCVGERDGAAFAHGDFVDPKAWRYVYERRDAVVNFGARPERLLFCGHTHVAAAWELGEDGETVPKAAFAAPAVKPETRGFRMRKGCRYIVNVGSVGYPRNDLCLTYAIWDTDTGRIAFRRLPFDFAGYVKAMLDSGVGLPGWLVRILLAAKM